MEEITHSSKCTVERKIGQENIVNTKTSSEDNIPAKEKQDDDKDLIIPLDKIDLSDDDITEG
eukprot:851220-Ditylum_brightwellii.AAC.1